MQEQQARFGMDVVAGGGIVASLMSWLPPIAALLGIVWYLLLFYEKVSGKEFHLTQLGRWVREKVKRPCPRSSRTSSSSSSPWPSRSLQALASARVRSTTGRS